MDKIDVFLLKEFGIMGGCCSAAKSIEYNVARRVAERLWMGVVISEDLEKAAKEYKDDNPFAGYSVENDYCAGAKWNKQQMMKGAVKGTVHHFDGDKTVAVHYIDPTGVPMSYFASSEGLETGDKVKLIIVKED